MFRMGKEEVEAIQRVVDSKQLFRVHEGGIHEVDTFEKDYAKVIGTDYALLLTSGTGALIAALVGIGAGPGDEIIVPGYTFMASASAVVAVGAIPVLAEIDETLTLDPADVERKITKNTKAIIPVHICGYPCNMDAICEIAKKHNLYVVEDACQADGGSYKGKRLGSIGDVGAFSFNFFKLISAGEGGCVTTSNYDIYQRALIYHDGGAAFRPYAKDLTVAPFIGTQMRANELLGAFMRAQLDRMDGIIADLRRIKGKIMDAISDLDIVKVAPSNDIKGDLGTTLPLRFADEKTTLAFGECEGIEGIRPFDSGKHVYSNWAPILEHRGAHCDALNPFKLKENQGLQMNYTADMLPNTLDILKRTFHITLHCDWTDEKVEEVIKAIRNAAEKLSK